MNKQNVEYSITAIDKKCQTNSVQGKNQFN